MATIVKATVAAAHTPRTMKLVAWNPGTLVWKLCWRTRPLWTSVQLRGRRSTDHWRRWSQPDGVRGPLSLKRWRTCELLIEERVPSGSAARDRTQVVAATVSAVSRSSKATGFVQPSSCPAGQVLAAGVDFLVTAPMARPAMHASDTGLSVRGRTADATARHDLAAAFYEAGGRSSRRLELAERAVRFSVVSSAKNTAFDGKLDVPL